MLKYCFCFVSVYVTVSIGNDGAGGFQTTYSLGDTPGVMGVASVDSIDRDQNSGISLVSF